MFFYETSEAVGPGVQIKSPTYIWCHMRYPQGACLACDCPCTWVSAFLPWVLCYIHQLKWHLRGHATPVASQHTSPASHELSSYIFEIGEKK